MKRILYISVLSVLITLGSCNKMVNEEPISEGTLGSFFKNKLDADAAVASMYGEFQSTMIKQSTNGQHENRMTWWGEARSDNWERRLAYATNNQNEIDFNALTSINTLADWSYLYSTIGRANLLIKRLPEIKNYTPVGAPGALPDALEKSYTAQAYAMRALCYFWIVRVWGDAPLRTEPYDDSQQAAQPKDPQAKLLAQIKADLQRAYDLTAKNATPTVFYLGEGAICAIMADVYMWEKDHQNAIVWFKRLFAAKAPTGKVFNSSGVSATGSGGATTDLQPGISWNAQFLTPAASVESIFYIHWDVANNGCACMSGVSRTTNEPLIRMADPLWTVWPTVATANYGGATVATIDLRVKQTYNITSVTNVPIRDRGFWKFYAGTYVAPTASAGYNFTPLVYTSNLPATDQTNVFIPVYRLGGMYLMYAEALNKIGDKTNAVKYLNIVRNRAGLPSAPETLFPDQNALELTILRERQFELIGEGVRWFDLVRTDRVIEIMDPILKARQLQAGNAQVGWGTDKRRYYWPINVNVLNSNNLLTQSAPYGGL